MRRLVIGFLAAAGIVAGAGAATIVNAAPIPKTDCDNTWCAPGDQVCYELTGWGCSLNGGCSGTQRCAA
jgi:hypothetical protein